MDDYVRDQKHFDRTLEWNEAGWNGAGVTVWDCEGMTSHGQMTRQRILDAAPKANVLNYCHCKMFKGLDLMIEFVQLDDETKVSADEFIKRNHVSILSHSHSGNGDKRQPVIDLYAYLKSKYNLALFNSAGNDGSEGVQGGAMPESLSIYVGAAIAFKHNFDDIRMANYSSLGDEYEEVDFSHFVGKAGWNGTSFSTPYLAGIAALLQQRYGFDTTQAEMYAYFKMISRPIASGHPSVEDPSYDYWSGWGMPILPPVDKKYVVMQIGKKAFKADGVWTDMDTAPFIEKQRTFVPIAFAALALGAKVTWDEKNRRVTVVKGSRRLEMTIGSRSYMVNGKPYTMDVAPFIKDQRTFVPIAFVALALDCKVSWVPEDRKVLILEN
jgi:hypothetical protein